MDLIVVVYIVLIILVATAVVALGIYLLLQILRSYLGFDELIERSDEMIKLLKKIEKNTRKEIDYGEDESEE